MRAIGVRRLTVVVPLLLAWSCGSDGNPPLDVPDVASPHETTAADSLDVVLPPEVDLRADLPPEAAPSELFEDARETDVVLYPPLSEGAGVRMEIQTETPALPFPFDWFTEPDETRETGLRMSLAGDWGGSVLLAAVLKMIPSYAEDAATMDGFGSLGLIILPINTPMSDVVVASAAGKDVLLFEVPADGPAVQVPFALAWQEAEYSGTPTRLLEVTPHHALAERTVHLLLVRRSLVDAAGLPFEPSPMAEVLLGMREPFGPKVVADRMEGLRNRTLDALSLVPGAPPAQELAAAILFTVGTKTLDLLEVAAEVEAAEIPVDLDPDGDGKDNVYTADKFPPYAGNPPAGVGLVVEGRFLSPDYRGPDGLIGSDRQNQVWHDFFVVLPAASEKEPFPLVIIQHGINSHKEAELGLARQAAAEGIAAASFDFLHHGKGESGGGFAFVQIDGARKTVGNFRQSALDMLAFARALEGMAGKKDLYPISGPDGIADLSADPVAFSGHSLGALESSIAGALSARPTRPRTPTCSSMRPLLDTPSAPSCC